MNTIDSHNLVYRDMLCAEQWQEISSSLFPTHYTRDLAF
jgi:hypothetical protein